MRPSQNFSFRESNLSFMGKADFWPLFQAHFTKPTEFWEIFIYSGIEIASWGQSYYSIALWGLLCGDRA
jgi:hypothetical protein